MKTILTILGARPQFVKAATVSREIRSREGYGVRFRERIVHTGQHFDYAMSEVFFKEMDIPKPDFNLGVNSVSHGVMTGRMLEQIDYLLEKHRVDLVLVYGDTNSTLAGALAASKKAIPVAHVEAGLRSYMFSMPEEINRILTDRMSSLLLCPSVSAVHTLEVEFQDEMNHSSDLNRRIVFTGDVMYDAVKFYMDAAIKRGISSPELQFETGRKKILITLHRQENVDSPDRLSGILKGMEDLALQNEVIFPIHPRTKSKIDSNSLKSSKIKFVDPVGYFDLLNILNACDLVVTDSGGLQKEAFFLRKFCVTARDVTEWTELVDIKVNKIVGADSAVLKEACLDFLKQEFPDRESPYGDGNASELVVDELMKLV